MHVHDGKLVRCRAWKLATRADVSMLQRRHECDKHTLRRMCHTRLKERAPGGVPSRQNSEGHVARQRASGKFSQSTEAPGEWEFAKVQDLRARCCARILQERALTPESHCPCAQGVARVSQACGRIPCMSSRFSITYGDLTKCMCQRGKRCTWYGGTARRRGVKVRRP